MKKFRKLIYGVGINDATYPVTRSEKINGKSVKVWRCPFYATWSSMLQRGYSQKFKIKNTTYKDCHVCEEWMTFSVFSLWMQSQDWQGNRLDKDFLGDGKLYSPENCCFVPNFVNTCVVLSDSIRGDLPLGVSLCKSSSKFLAMIKDRRNNEKGQKNLGRYSNPLDAHKAWQTAKLVVLKSILADYKDIPNNNVKVVNKLEGVIEKVQTELLTGKETRYLI